MLKGKPDTSFQYEGPGTCNKRVGKIRLTDISHEKTHLLIITSEKVNTKTKSFIRDRGMFHNDKMFNSLSR